MTVGMGWGGVYKLLGCLQSAVFRCVPNTPSSSITQADYDIHFSSVSHSSLQFAKSVPSGSSKGWQEFPPRRGGATLFMNQGFVGPCSIPKDMLELNLPHKSWQVVLQDTSASRSCSTYGTGGCPYHFAKQTSQRQPQNTTNLRQTAFHSGVLVPLELVAPTVRIPDGMRPLRLPARCSRRGPW